MIDFKNVSELHLTTLEEVNVYSALVGLIGTNKFNVNKNEVEIVITYKENPTFKFIFTQKILDQYAKLVLEEVNRVLNEYLDDDNK